MKEIASNLDFTQQINEILHLPSPLEKLEEKIFEEMKLKVFVKRDDLIHAEISGNKWRKLKYNLLNAIELGYKSILTFGGAFSNHIYATAATGKYFGFETIGIIRGDELNENSSKTLEFASECGMKLHFVSRSEYREMRENPQNHSLIQYQLRHSLTHSKLIPEGGSNEYALGGVGEMVEEIETQLGFEPDYIICPVGTGGTVAGIIAKSNNKTKILGICVLKNGQYLMDEINLLIENASVLSEGGVQNSADVNCEYYEIFWNFHHGGYGKKTTELIDFVSKFNANHDFEIEPIYSGKMFFAFYELIKQFTFEPNSTVVLIHTGGLQS